MDKLVKPPWTEDQIASLNACQSEGPYHGFTCGGGGGPESCIGGVVIAWRLLDDGTTYEQRHHSYLLAVEDGWICPRCGHRQYWAYSWMADWSWQTAC